MAAPPEPETSAKLSSPPFVALKGVANFRELGGYPTAENEVASVRRGYMYRCGDPTKATSEALSKLQALGITHIYDLHSRPEIEKFGLSGQKGAYEWPGIERVYAPVIPDEGWDPVSQAKRHAEYIDEKPEGMANAYRALLNDGATAYTTMMRHILERPPPENAFIFHCTAGKDRTGVFAALVLSICGVSDEIIATEYNLTEQGLGEWMEFLIKRAAQGGALTEAQMRRMAGARKETMLIFLQILRDDYGGALGYLENNCGLSQEEIAAIRKALVVEEQPTVTLGA